ncbi:hypothetical protein SAMN04515647_1530 [Cohaesibacter sp. ES.047]|uniref:hypothetical protein n=1 Tax=Cohaesibacter sp. ES.047 TaxID=1798205 RepID=UPI000BB91347|nr:hypothetical protein [Cohaesibacter sp. ES.047]SNY91313.1 hypothetical protein SAMN04515647_1530 [Cohaesibacter sp. ES.047]
MYAFVKNLADMLAPGIKAQVRSQAEDGLLFGLASLICLVGAGFATLAIFLVLEQQLGAIIASLIMGAFAFLMGGGILIYVLRRRRLRQIRRAIIKEQNREAAATSALLGQVTTTPLLMLALGAGFAAASYITRGKL